MAEYASPSGSEPADRLVEYSSDEGTRRSERPSGAISQAEQASLAQQRELARIAEILAVECDMSAARIRDVLGPLAATLEAGRAKRSATGPRCKEVNLDRCRQHLRQRTEGDGTAPPLVDTVRENNLIATQMIVAATEIPPSEDAALHNEEAPGDPEPIHAGTILSRKGKRPEKEQRMLAIVVATLQAEPHGLTMVEVARFTGCTGVTLGKYAKEWSSRLDNVDRQNGAELLRQIAGDLGLDEAIAMLKRNEWKAPVWEKEKTRRLVLPAKATKETTLLFARAQALLDRTIDYFPKPFPAGAAVQVALKVFEHPGKKIPKDIPPHIAALCELDPLSATNERLLFHRMNYVKYRATRLRNTLQSDCLHMTTIVDIELLLEEAKRIRNLLIRTNMRLVVSIIKKFVGDQFDFDDLMTDGVEPLMDAIDHFDYSRGFRFSTYAYRSIFRRTKEAVEKKLREDARFLRNDDEEGHSAVETLADEKGEGMSEQKFADLQANCARLLDALDAREQIIIRNRFGMGQTEEPLTLKEVADLLGLSKERVRQLEKRALAKLRTMSEERQRTGMILLAKAPECALRETEVPAQESTQIKADATWLIAKTSSIRLAQTQKCIGISEGPYRNEIRGGTLLDALNNAGDDSKSKIAAAHRMEAAITLVTRYTTLTTEQVRRLFIDDGVDADDEEDEDE